MYTAMDEESDGLMGAWPSRGWRSTPSRERTSMRTLLLPAGLLPDTGKLVFDEVVRDHLNG